MTVSLAWVGGVITRGGDSNIIPRYEVIVLQQPAWVDRGYGTLRVATVPLMLLYSYSHIFPISQTRGLGYMEIRVTATKAKENKTQKKEKQICKRNQMKPD